VFIYHDGRQRINREKSITDRDRDRDKLSNTSNNSLHNAAHTHTHTLHEAIKTMKSTKNQTNTVISCKNKRNYYKHFCIKYVTAAHFM